MPRVAGRHVPRVSLGGSIQPSAAPERRWRPRRDCHQLHPEPASGEWGLSLSVLTAGKAKGKSVSTAPQPLAGWTFSPCFATGNVFLCPYLRVVHPDMLGCYSAATPGGGARGRAAEVTLGEREDMGLLQCTRLPRLLGTFKASLQLLPQTGWEPAPLSELQMALHLPACG